MRGTAAWHPVLRPLVFALVCLLPPSPPVYADSPIALQPVVAGKLEHPVYLAQPPDGSDRLFVVEQPGRIRVIAQGRLLPQPFLDIRARVRSSGAEQGLLGLAFHPDYAKNGRYVVNYTRAPDGATVVAEYRVSDQPNTSQLVERVLLVIAQPYTNHNGGMVEFGPDGFLYVGMGDGGSRGDPEDRGQDRQELLGKLLRLDVDRGAPYGIPADNPFVAGGGRPEIFAYGFRNPWRFSFDRETGVLWLADVGQNDWEEIDHVQRGANYGWRIMEGRHCFAPRHGCASDHLVLPVAEYPTRSPRCSITGGYVYRGRAVPGLRGAYLYADYCSGEVMAWRDGQQEVLLDTSSRIASFGQDQAGEVYVVGHEGNLFRIVAHDQSKPSTR